MHPLLWAFVACTTLHRARTYPAETEITSVDWYSPQEVVAGRTVDPFPKAPVGAVSQEALDAVRAYVAARNTAGFLVLRRGKLVDEWYADGFDVNSRTNGMSMSKTVTALAFGVLQGEGRLPAVDRPIAESVFPEWSGDATRSLITWRDLLEMESGLRNDEELKLGSDLVKMHLGRDIERTVLAVPGEHAPGFAFDYNNVDTQLLGLAIERASGQRLATVLSDRVWRPIGAGDAAVWLDKPDGTAHAYCCLFATPRDWARVGQLLLDGGAVGTTQVVPRDFVIRMTLPSRNNPDYGWQLWRADDGPGSERKNERSEPMLDRAMFWMDGKGSQRVYVLPGTGMVVVRVGEEPPDWDDAFVVNTLIRGVGK